MTEPKATREWITTNLLLDDDSEEALRTQQGLALLGEAEGLEVVDQASFALAGKARKEAKEEIKWWQDFFRPLKRAADAAKDALLAKEKEKLAGPQTAVAILDKKLEAFDAQQRRERAIAQARAAEEAKRLEAARPAPKPGEAPLPPIVVPAVAVPIPKSEDVGFATYWKAEVTDLMALVQAVAAGKVPLFYVEANEKALNDAARAAKAALNIPGVRPWDDRRARG